MKKYISLIVFSIIILFAFTVYGRPLSGKQGDGLTGERSGISAENHAEAENSAVKKIENQSDENLQTIRITVGDREFFAPLYGNSTAKAFVKRLPMTLTMSEMNGNEKFNYMSDALPTESVKPGAIQSGDIMLYGDDCLVLFYKDFSSSYSYTPLGKVEDKDGLAEALGSGNVEITFELK